MVKLFTFPPKPSVLADVQQYINSRRVTYRGDIVSVRRDIKYDSIVSSRPAIGEAAMCDITEHIDQHLAVDLMHPCVCLRPFEDWPF